MKHVLLKTDAKVLSKNRYSVTHDITWSALKNKREVK